MKKNNSYCKDNAICLFDESVKKLRRNSTDRLIPDVIVSG
jgi:hypothetical protein